MSKYEKLMLFLAILAIIISIIMPRLSKIIPALEPLSLYALGPIYFSQSDQKLKTVLDVSKITENLTKYYKFDITDPTLDLMIDANRYSGSGSFKFCKSYKRKTYVSLLEDILSRNEDKIKYDINEDVKVIFIRPKNQFEQFN